MKDTNTGDKKTEALQRKEDEPLTPSRHRWPTVLAISALIVAGGGGFGAIWWLSRAITDVSVAASFLVVNTLSLLIFLAIIAQACIYWAQRGIMNEQAKVMREGLEETRNLLRQNEWAFRENHRHANAVQTQMREQSQAMKGQLDAMKESLAETRKSMRYSQAAYITVKAIDATKFSVGEKIEVMVIYSNSGNTPAYNVDTYSRGGSREEPFSFVRDEIATDFQHGVHSKGILAPHDDMAQVFGTDIPLTIGTLAGLRTKPYHAWGVIFYQDIFKRDRWTQFCYVYREKREWAGEKGHFEICADCNKTNDQE